MYLTQFNTILKLSTKKTKESALILTIECRDNYKMALKFRKFALKFYI